MGDELTVAPTTGDGSTRRSEQLSGQTVLGTDCIEIKGVWRSRPMENSPSEKLPLKTKNLGEVAPNEKNLWRGHPK